MRSDEINKTETTARRKTQISETDGLNIEKAKKGENAAVFPMY